MLSNTKMWLVHVAKMNEAIHLMPRPWPKIFATRMREFCRLSAQFTKLPGYERKLADATTALIGVLPLGLQQQLQFTWRKRYKSLLKQMGV